MCPSVCGFFRHCCAAEGEDGDGFTDVDGAAGFNNLEVLENLTMTINKS